MRRIAIVGTGFVADLYAASLRTFPAIQVVACWDIDAARLQRFCTHWSLPAAENFHALLAADPEIVLNLTNPHAHHAVSKACLAAGRHVYSEKPLAMTMDEADELLALARERGLQIASAPASMLSEAAQAAWHAVAAGRIGTPRLTYAELDDDFISQAPVRKWHSASGAPWPVEDELAVGCTLEHAGYYLTWLMMMFGPVASIVSASAQVTDVSHLTDGPVAPDYSCATLFFESGMVARLTCSIVAPHDHRLRIIGDGGAIELHDCWNNRGAVKLRRRRVIRRRLINGPVAWRVRPLPAMRHPAVERRGAAAMNFALGPAEMLAAIADGRPSRLSGDFALHLTEVSLAIQAAGRDSGAIPMRTRFAPVAPIDWPAVLEKL